jgi:hypothetical protein
MMKLTRILLLALLLPFCVAAQDVAIKEGSAKMGKKKMWCFSARYDYGKKITKETVNEIMDNAGLRRNSHKKGVSKYKGASWSAISNSKCDYYYKLKGKKGRTTMYLAVSKGYDNFVTSTNDAEIAGNITRLLTDLQTQIATAQMIQEKEAELQKMNKENEAAKKQLKDAESQQAQKANEIKKLKEVRTSAPAVK